jgi:hypothetical protein
LIVDPFQLFEAGVRTVTFTAVVAKGGIVGKFASVLVADVHYRADVVYHPNDIVVTLTRLSRPRQVDPADTVPSTFLYRRRGPR